MQAEAALAAFQQGLPLPAAPPTALAPGSAGAAMAAAGNLVATSHNAAAAAAGTLPPVTPAALAVAAPGVLAGAGGLLGVAAGGSGLLGSLAPTAFLAVTGMVSAQALGDPEECEEVGV